MKNSLAAPRSVDDYIGGFPDELQRVLRRVRRVIQRAVPTADEVICYQMPTYRMEGNLVHFALCKNHLGFYPAPSGIAAFSRQLAGFKTSKGAVQFPLDQPIPLDLIRDIVMFRVKENRAKAAAKNARPSASDL